MASVTKDSKGWRVRYYDSTSTLRTIRPGKVNKAAAEKIGHYIDQLNAAKISGMGIDRHAATWLAEIGDGLRKKLERAGLVEPAEPVEAEPAKVSMLLKDFLQDHIHHGRTSQGKAAATSTLAKWVGTQRFLNDRFPNRTLESIVAEDAHQFRVWLDTRKIRQTTSPRKGEPMAENGKRKHIANCKAFFNAAKRRGLIDRNPFEAQVSTTGANRARDHYITPEDTRRILDACPDAEWRLLVALWRLAGLRKMEVFNLRWSDVNWDSCKLLVRSTKTAHHENCDIRFTPLRDVLPYLEAVHHQAKDGAEFIITRFSKSNSNLDKPFRKIIENAGLIPWAKLFQNLRSSCETQWLKEGARADLVANWIGHSLKIQNKNYVQQTDDDILSFNQTTGQTASSKSGHTGGHEGTRIEEKSPEVAIQVAMRKGSKNAEDQCFSYSSEPKTLPWAGLEHTSKNTGFGGTSEAGGHTGGHIAPNSEVVARFTDELRARGFTPKQIRAISEAMNAANVTLVRTAEATR
jgi:integrase